MHECIMKELWINNERGREQTLFAALVAAAVRLAIGSQEASSVVASAAFCIASFCCFLVIRLVLKIFDVCWRWSGEWLQCCLRMRLRVRRIMRGSMLFIGKGMVLIRMYVKKNYECMFARKNIWIWSGCLNREWSSRVFYACVNLRFLHSIGMEWQWVAVLSDFRAAMKCIDWNALCELVFILSVQSCAGWDLAMDWL